MNRLEMDRLEMDRLKMDRQEMDWLDPDKTFIQAILAFRFEVNVSIFES